MFFNYYKLVIIFVFFVVTLLSTSCSNRRKDKYLEYIAPATIDLKDFVSNSSVESVGFDAPTGVGRLLAQNDKGVYACTAFLVDADLMMTNSHCIPADIRHKKDNCLDHPFYVIFENEEEAVTCKEQLYSSKIPSEENSNALIDNEDFALFRINKRLDRNLLEMKEDNFEEDSLVKIWKMDRGVNSYKSILNRVYCRIKYNSFAAIQANSPYSHLLFLGDCNINDGNSGSPVFDMNGKVGGVLYGSGRRDKKKIFDRQISNFGLATNSKCFPGPPYSSSNFCGPSAMNDLLFNKLIVDHLQAYIDSKDGPIDKLLSYVDKEQYEKFAVKSKKVVKVKEIKSIDNFPEVYVELRPECKNNKSIDDEDITFPICKMHLSFNKYLQVDDLYASYCHYNFNDKSIRYCED